jgi:hypothetical protein
MKKICRLACFVLILFTIKCFGENAPNLDSTDKLHPVMLPFPGDTIRKASTADSAKKASDDSTGDDNVRSYAIGLNYGSDQSYHGVHSNTKLPYLEPNFTYTAPSGFYTELLDQDYLLGKGERYNAFGITPGWDIDLTDNTSLNFNLTHYFTSAHPPPSVISSDISNSIETYISQDMGEKEGKLTIDYDYYKKTAKIKTPNDWVITPDVKHTFEIDLSKKSSLSFIPEGSVDFGTRNLYSHFSANSGSDTTLTNEEISKLTRQQKKQLEDELEQQATNNSSFGTLDYNLILSINFKVGHFEFEPALNYTSPLYKPVGQPNTPLGYITINLTYTIY